MKQRHYHMVITVPTDDGHAHTDRFHTDRYEAALTELIRHPEPLSVGIRRVRRCNDPESVKMERLY